MPGFTVPYNLPYPLPGDPTGPQAVQDLVEAVDNLAVFTLAALDAANDATVSAIASGGPASVVNGTGSVVCFAKEVSDTGDLVDIAVSPCQFNIPTSGIWMVSGYASWAAESGVGPRGCTVLVNSATVARAASTHPVNLTDGGWSLSATWIGQINAGQSVQLRADHVTGTSGVTVRTVSYYRLFAARVA